MRGSTIGLIVALIVTWSPTASHAQGPIAVGVRIVINSPSGSINVRQAPGGALLGEQLTGALGTVIGGPVQAPIAGSSDPTSFTWWPINYDTGIDGWSGQDNMAVTTIPVPPPPPPPPAPGAGMLTASWTEPTTNTDGTPLTDLASYRLYYGTAPTPCPGTLFITKAAPVPTPAANSILTQPVTGLIEGTRYYVSVTALDTQGNESVCSQVATAIVPTPPPPPPPPPGPSAPTVRARCTVRIEQGPPDTSGGWTGTAYANSTALGTVPRNATVTAGDALTVRWVKTGVPTQTSPAALAVCP